VLLVKKPCVGGRRHNLNSLEKTCEIRDTIKRAIASKAAVRVAILQPLRILLCAGAGKRLNADFGRKYLFQITSLDIENYKAKRLNEHKVRPATVNRELALCKIIFNKAIQWGIFRLANPVKQVAFLKENNKRLRFLSKEEIIKLYEFLSGEALALVKFAINTGMRRGEIMKLTWHDIDILQRLIYIKDSKSGESRVIPMNETLVNLLCSLRKGADVSPVFSSVHRTAFENALEEAKIDDASFHTLRHTFASHLAMEGVDLFTLSKLLGHSDIKMTMRYAHLGPNHMAKAMQVMDTIWTPRCSEPEAEYLQLIAA